MQDTPLEQANTDAGDRLKISETFVSLQGEGGLTGVPSWFVRLSGCNLRCVWCDTPYASWSPEGEARMISDLIAEALDSGVRHAVVTGGEPMLFDGVEPLCARLREAGMHVTIETAGTIDRDVACDLMSLSPKLSNSTPVDDPRDPGGWWAGRHEARRTDLAPLRGLLDRFAGHQFKFVVTGPDDMAEIDALLEAVGPVDPGRVFLMPEGVEVPSPEAVAWVVETCTRHGFRYGHRLHIELFGDTRGT